MMRFNEGLIACGLILALAGCSRDSGTAKTDSAAAGSTRDAHSVTDSSGPAAGIGSSGDSVQAPINSTAGTIGETRRSHVRMHAPDTMDRDSVIPGPYKMMDSLGRIKR